MTSSQSLADPVGQGSRELTSRDSHGIDALVGHDPVFGDCSRRVQHELRVDESALRHIRKFGAPDIGHPRRRQTGDWGVYCRVDYLPFR